MVEENPMIDRIYMYGAKWNPKINRKKSGNKKRLSFREINVILASSRHRRFSEAERNCIKITGKNRL